jgi:hypothetical protein
MMPERHPDLDPHPEFTQAKMRQMVEDMEKAAKERKEKKAERKKCRWCESVHLRPLTNNGVIGPGYRVDNWVCCDCGKVQ